MRGLQRSLFLENSIKFNSIHNIDAFYIWDVIRHCSIAVTISGAFLHIMGPEELSSVDIVTIFCFYATDSNNFSSPRMMVSLLCEFGQRGDARQQSERACYRQF